MIATNAKTNATGGKLLLVDSKLGTSHRTYKRCNRSIRRTKLDLQSFAVSNDTYFTNGSLWGMYGNTTFHLINLVHSSCLGKHKVVQNSVYRYY
jgi:hypothetical protein